MRAGGEPGVRGSGAGGPGGPGTREPLGPIAKITRPTAEGAIRRERLFRRLDEAGNRPLTWICGPPGSGKTVLASSYVEARGPACLWYQVDPGDGDPAGFFYYLGLACEGAASTRGSPLPLLTPDHLPGVSGFSRRFFEELFARLSPSAVLVFDNLHEVPADGFLHEALLAGVAHMPAGVRLILVSRSGPPPPYARALATREMAILGWEDLRLTPEEFRQIVRLQALGEDQERVLQALYGRMDGWAAGLQLVLEGVRRHGIDPAGTAGSTPDEIFEYFAHEVFRRLDGATRSFLVRTAFLPTVTPATARALTGNRRAGRILAYLHRSNHFTERRGRTHRVYRYHPLFREFLLHQARASLTSAEVARIQRAAAALLAEAGRDDEAAGLLRDAGDWGALAALILDRAPVLVRQGRYATLRRWVEPLPRQVLEGDPWLLYWAGVSLQPLAPARARGHFERALQVFEARGDAPGVLLAWSGVVDSIVWGFDRLELLDGWVERFERSLKGYWTPQERTPAARVTISMLNVIAMRKPRLPGRAAWVDRGMALLEAPVGPSPKVQVLTPLVLSELFEGNLDRAGELLLRFEIVERSDGSTPVGRISRRNLTAHWCWLSARFEEARREAKAGLDLARREGVHFLDFALLGHVVAGALGAGEPNEARRYLERMAARVAARPPWERGFYHLLAVWEALLRKDVGTAAPHARQALECATRAGMPRSMATSHLAVALVAHAQGDGPGALRHLDAAARWACSDLDEVGWRLAAAEIALDRGDEEAGLGALRQGLETGRRRGYLNWWFFRPDAVARLCVKALEEGIEASYVQQLVRRRGLVPDRPPLDVDGWPWPVRVYTLGRFDLVRDGEPVRFGGKKPQRRPLALLKALIAFGGRDVPEARIADALWPDADPDMALRSCAIAVHRLRRLLGCNQAILRRDGRLTLDARWCWVDAWAFERAMGRAEAAWAAGPRAAGRALGLATKALSLYRGPFLHHDPDAPWAVERRERLRSRFRLGVERLGRELEAAGRWEEALEHYERALRIEPVAEALYRRLMGCYQELGRTAEAVETYRRCRKVLAARLGVAPSPATEAAFRRLGRG